MSQCIPALRPRADGAQPFVIEREGGAAQKATEEVHCVFAIDDIEKTGPCFDQAVFEARGAFSIADDGVFQCRSFSEHALTFHVIDNFFSRFHDVFAVVEVANDEIPVFFHSLSQCFRVCEDVVGFPRRGDGFSKYEFFSTHSDFCAVGCLKSRHDVLLMSLVGYSRCGQFSYIRFAMSVSSARDTNICGVVNDVAKFIRVVFEIKEFRACPAQIIEFPAVCANHEDWRFAHIPVVSREDAVTKIVFGVGVFARLVGSVVKQRGKATSVDVFRDGQVA